MKKVAVQTFWTSQYNYGQILQGYALQQFLRKKGYDAYIIRFDSVLSRLKEKLLVMLRGKLWVDYKQRKLRHFDKFKKQNIVYSKRFYPTFRSLLNNPPDANYYIVGSDQVWTYMRNEERRNGYLLRFGDKGVKKLAYAASFGRNKLESNEESVFIDSLKGFCFVGVREKKAVELCNNLGVKSYWVIDPVALLTADEWRKIAAPLSFHNEGGKRMFLYSLTSSVENSAISSILGGFAKSYAIYYTNSSELFDNKMNVMPTIQEWISYIDSCDCVVTDSFHCTLFCILLQKNFVTIKRYGGEKMSDRLISLLGRLHLLDRYVDASVKEIEKKLDERIDWDLTNAELNFWCTESKKVLLNKLK